MVTSNKNDPYQLWKTTVARERFLDRGAQNGKIVLTSARLRPLDPPFLRCTFLGTRHTANLS